MSYDLAEKLNLMVYTLVHPTFEMISGYGIVLGITKVQVKIFKITKKVLVFILKPEYKKHIFLVGLDLIAEFQLCQDEKLRISQKWCHKKRKFKSKYKSQFPIVNNIEMKADLSHLDEIRSSAMLRIISQFNEAFAKNKFDAGQVKDHEAG